MICGDQVNESAITTRIKTNIICYSLHLLPHPPFSSSSASISSIYSSTSFPLYPHTLSLPHLLILLLLLLPQSPSILPHSSTLPPSLLLYIPLSPPPSLPIHHPLLSSHPLSTLPLPTLPPLSTLSFLPPPSLPISHLLSFSSFSFFFHIQHFFPRVIRKSNSHLPISILEDRQAMQSVQSLL